MVNTPLANIELQTQSSLDDTATELVELLNQYNDTIAYAQKAIKHYYDLSVAYKQKIDASKTQVKRTIYEKKIKKNNKNLFNVLVKERQLLKLRDELLKREGININDNINIEGRTEG